ncbi:hypothetical protein CALCODRAFT_556244 [Calocera cornea HHB12733]|uniref:ELMO domain-containing protein n=1 Tax=Calocera cornea HHB12733 TaxID=1353952 RepID=A0A165EYV4_9BASI|nr:hypothetical protein CALCODRAFT_556244 [Calocera cornea HHB12733]
MATYGSPVTPTANGKGKTPVMPKVKTGIPHTNTVESKDGQKVRARIDPSLATSEVVRQLCLNLKLTETSKLYALRTDTDELVTDDNLSRIVRDKTPLKLTNAPAIDAAEIVSKLQSRDDFIFRPALRELKKYIKEDEFLTAFLHRDGLRQLLAIIEGYHGNVLSAALTAMDNLMEMDRGWENLPSSFVTRIVTVITTESSINVSRPAISILKRLVEADPRHNPAPGPSSSRGTFSGKGKAPMTVYNYGFDVVYAQTRVRPAFLETVVDRLSSPEATTALNSLRLINALIASVTDEHWDDFIRQLEQLNVRKKVIRLMDNNHGDDLASSILDFQSNIVRITYRRKTTPVDTNNEVHREMLNRVLLAADVPAGDGDEDKWARLGFETDDMRAEFSRVGVLGLECMHDLAVRDREDFSKMILAQANRDPQRRCPFAQASNEVVELLAEHWNIFSGYSTSTSYQPFLLAFHRVHNLTTRFFLRMWNESSATLPDFPRVAALVRSQVKVVLKSESTTSWFEVEREMLESEYRKVRERQMEKLELEDDLLNKAPVRRLREDLYNESFNFVRDQRFQCLMDGAWFVNAVPVVTAQKERPQRAWRFFRLDKTKKYLHYVDSTVKMVIRGGLEDLPDRIEVSQIAEVQLHTGAAAPGLLPNAPSDITANGMSAHPHSFSLISAQGYSLADQVAESAATFSDWVDGLSMLRRDGSVVGKETQDMVNVLTEIGLKIKLLDLTGEKIDIPTAIAYEPPPDNLDFFFAD